MNSRKQKITILVFFTLSILTFLVSVGNGAVQMSPVKIIKTLLFDQGSTSYQIIWNVRIPRTIVAALVGINLSLAGVVLQGIMRNPLASPSTIGVSAGAGLVGLIFLILFPQYYYLAPIGSFLGALGATMLIYGLAWNGGVMPTRMILAGVAVSSLFGAGNNALMTFYPDRVSGVLNFMVGGLASITWGDLKLILPYTIICGTILMFLPTRLNVLMLGDEVSTGLGLNVEKTRFLFIILSSFLAGSAVSVVGLLGFVGLMVPHITRILIGSDHKYLLPACIFTGAIFVMLCDTVSRVIFQPTEVPVGIIISAIGAPFFLYLLKGKGGLSYGHKRK
ncbi:Fe(3+)-citrate import system permease protein yfmE Ferric-citrate import system permease protein [Proteiniborus sp. DW1]|uniref:FecCD family ABC transporter permease n=1 Tax=Proteiniborus sp. DW1 TaxID=1889883 RepID=UPI00092DFBBD|nr:iron ABC transporter permease [Proteiniborus sp. DW1]SCG82837.1 Fe(3+)-citrate import system permease protein yfmE Ferric-citrate import system permease protein [Proteiniborus sp. DW1]